MKIFVKLNFYKTMNQNPQGSLRGLHFLAKPPFQQAKLVRCIEGNVIDVVVDIRKGSPTYGTHMAFEPSGGK